MKYSQMRDDRRLSRTTHLTETAGLRASTADNDIVQEGRQTNENEAFLRQPVSSMSSSIGRQGLKDSAKNQRPSTTLHRSAFVLILVLAYAGLALFAWVVTCILAFRPIVGPKQYGVWVRDGFYGENPIDLNKLYMRSANWYRAARVIQSIVSVLTIPLTSAVCSSAAVVFVQHSSSLTIRKLMTLADKTWADPASFSRAVFNWKRYGSSFLLLAILLNLLGFLISPLQEIFLTTTTRKTPTSPETVGSLLDIPDQWKGTTSGEYDRNLIVVLTRNALMTASNVQPQAQLWQGAGTSCSALEIEAALNNKTGDGLVPDACAKGMTFGNISDLAEPFLAELPNGYSTGLIRQFIPRINSTAIYDNITAAEYPSGCDQIAGAFSAEYSGKILDSPTDSAANWSIQACMPTDQRHSPWTSTRDRQDFNETLYLNVSVAADGRVPRTPTPAEGSLFKVTLTTTAGYFELPNYMNGGVAGPLLDKDPNNIWGHNCTSEGDGSDIDIWNVDANSTKVHRANDNPNVFNFSAPNSSLALELVFNKGPLLTTAMALFGNGSFLANRIAHPEAYYGVNFTVSEQTGLTDPINAGSCADLAPLSRLLADSDGVQETWDGSNTGGVDYCIQNNLNGGWVRGPYGSDLSLNMLDWIDNFRRNPGRLANAFTAAGFLANQAWMLNQAGPGGGSEGRSLTISYDYGGDVEVPTISMAGLIIISILLALDLLALFIMAIYASYSPRWTNQLDSFAMMRIATAMADPLPLMVGLKKDKLKMLDQTSGWIGDTAEEHEEIGQLGLGAPKSINKGRRYECYPPDHEPLSANETYVLAVSRGEELG